MEFKSPMAHQAKIPQILLMIGFAGFAFYDIFRVFRHIREVD